MGYQERNVPVVKEPVRRWKKKNGEHQYCTYVPAKPISQCRCRKCKGEKVVKEKTRQEIFIEKGMSDRQRIILAGAGDQEVVLLRHPNYIQFWTWCMQPGVPAGDVVFLLKAVPHESFERSGNDLLTHITITLSEALLGFSRVIITHLDGRGIKLSTPPGKIIKPQDSIVLRGEGMPLYRRPDEKGDLYVLIDIEMPDQGWLASIDHNVSLLVVVFVRS